MYIKKTQMKVILCLGFLGSVSMWSLHPSQPCFSGCCFVVLRPNKTQYTCPRQPWDLWQKVPPAACFLPLLPNRSLVQQEEDCFLTHVITTSHTHTFVWADVPLVPCVSRDKQICLLQQPLQQSSLSWPSLPDFGHRNAQAQRPSLQHNTASPPGDPGPVVQQQQNLTYHRREDGCKGTPITTCCQHF